MQVQREEIKGVTVLSLQDDLNPLDWRDFDWAVRESIAAG